MIMDESDLIGKIIRFKNTRDRRGNTRATIIGVKKGQHGFTIDVLMDGDQGVAKFSANSLEDLAQMIIKK
jgi:hypothetical protein